MLVCFKYKKWTWPQGYDRGDVEFFLKHGHLSAAETAVDRAADAEERTLGGTGCRGAWTPSGDSKWTPGSAPRWA